jgi:hypothetical protein
MAPGRGRGHLYWRPLIFKFFNLCFIGSVGFDDHLTDSSLASILFASTSLGGGCSAGEYQQIVKNMQKKSRSHFREAGFSLIIFG